MESVRASLLSLEEAATAFGALGSEQRLSVLQVLVGAGPEGVTMGTLGQRTGIGASTLTHHLRILTSAELVNQRREGRSVICTAAFDAVERLSDYLLLNCCTDAPADGQPHDTCKRTSDHG